MTSNSSANQQVERTIRVGIPVEQAFALFTEGMGRWWAAQNTFSRDDYETVLVEPKTGGRWYERNTAGDELLWGHVVAWEPPHHVALTWQITAQGTPEPDAEKASRIDVRFRAAGDNETDVHLTHSAFDRHGAEAGAIWFAGMDSDETGWTYFLRRYAAAAQPG